MTPKYLVVLLLALSASVAAQHVDELNIPDENDNQFPPDNHSESVGSVLDGSEVEVNSIEPESIFQAVADGVQPLDTTEAEENSANIFDNDDSVWVLGEQQQTEVPEVLKTNAINEDEILGDNYNIEEALEDTDGGLDETNDAIDNEANTTDAVDAITETPLGNVGLKEDTDTFIGDLPQEQTDAIIDTTYAIDTTDAIHTDAYAITDTYDTTDAIITSDDVDNTDDIDTDAYDTTVTSDDVDKSNAIDPDAYDTTDATVTSDDVDQTVAAEVTDAIDTTETTEAYDSAEAVDELPEKTLTENTDVLVTTDLEDMPMQTNDEVTTYLNINEVESNEPLNQTGDDEELLEAAETSHNTMQLYSLITPLESPDMQNGTLEKSDAETQDIETVPQAEDVQSFKASEADEPVEISKVIKEDVHTTEIMRSPGSESLTTETTEEPLEIIGATSESTLTLNDGTRVIKDNQNLLEVTKEEPLDVTRLLITSPEATSESLKPENVQTLNITPVLTDDVKSSCPEPCICVTEGDSSEYKVDCSGHGLTDLPKSLDLKTTELNLENNNLTEISNEISALKNLKALNANNNEIMEIVSGSLSELPNLTSLKLGRNRLLEYPQELMNFGLTKLQELDLSGNDMDLKPETFSNFTSLHKLTLPSSKSEIVQDLCASLKESLQTVCTGSCDANSIDCAEASEDLKDTLDFALPGMIAFSNEPEDNVVSGGNKTEVRTTKTIPEELSSSTALETTLDPVKNVVQLNEITASSVDVKAPVKLSSGKAGNLEPSSIENSLLDFALPGLIAISTGSGENRNTNENKETITSSPTQNTNANDVATQASEFSLRSAVNGAPGTDVKEKADEANKDNIDVVVGATTEVNKGGVDKSVIGIIVAGMVLVIAGITIKKNWSSIKNRFNSSPRTANDRVNANGGSITPEEVPLQQKLPV